MTRQERFEKNVLNSLVVNGGYSDDDAEKILFDYQGDCKRGFDSGDDFDEVACEIMKLHMGLR